ncbi:OmpA family protein [Aurantibacillus circumpalustris]|uniref:OmpA family protein n=1 Tax=Aurantibacillus circumpalustris TaxID=3036359 RepID=UPI00295B29D0|nr:OmpA family protein [Aurantibacillus circumpalustris]
MRFKKNKNVILILLFVFIGNISFSQGSLPPGQFTSTNKKAIKHLNEGKKAFEVKNDAQAEKSFLKALDEDNKFIEAALGLANLYQLTNHHDKAIEYFKKAIEINPKFYTYSFYFLAQSLLATGQYEEAKKSLDVFLSLDRINPDTKDKAARMLVNAEFGITAVKNPKQFSPVNVGEGINTDLNEYFPAVTADGKSFMFTRGLRVPDFPQNENEDFFMSVKRNDVWQEARPIYEINTPGNEGAPTLSADGNVMFFVSCANQFGEYSAPDRKGYGSCDIFYAQKIDGRWTRPRNAGSSINTSHWETQPSFSSDGKTLYFIRGHVVRGGVREQDIYYSVIGEDGRFSEAVKLSSVVNTPYKEESVFIHPDNQTLYFSSEGHPGMGGLDIFMTKRQANGEWGTPVNLGYPINSYEDDNSLLVDPEGKLAFFASARKGGYGGLDIYQFELPADVRPEKITYVKGKVYNAKTKEPLEASFELINLETQLQTTKSYSQKNGEFFVTLTANKNYLVNVSKEGFLFYSDNFSLKEIQADFNKPFQLDIPLEPIDVGSIVELKNIFFDVDKWDLKPESKAELDKLISFLTKNSNLKVELGGHTDNSGDKKNNLTLSSNRAKSVYNYLISEGKIVAERLSYKGYGDTMPKAPNDTPENKAKNRRTEFKIIGK